MLQWFYISEKIVERVNGLQVLEALTSYSSGLICMPFLEKNVNYFPSNFLRW